MSQAPFDCLHRTSAAQFPASETSRYCLQLPQDQKLQAARILNVAKALIEERMKDQQYDPVKGAQVRRGSSDAGGKGGEDPSDAAEDPYA